MCSNEEKGGGTKAALYSLIMEKRDALVCSSTSTKVLFLVIFSYLPKAEAFWSRMDDGGGVFLSTLGCEGGGKGRFRLSAPLFVGFFVLWVLFFTFLLFFFFCEVSFGVSTSVETKGEKRPMSPSSSSSSEQILVGESPFHPPRALTSGRFSSSCRRPWRPRWWAQSCCCPSPPIG